MGLIADFGSGAAAIDTAVFIPFIEEGPRFLPYVLPLFAEADQGKRARDVVHRPQEEVAAYAVDP